MAGEIGANYLYGINNPYSQNSYSSAINNDFMAQAMLGAGQQQSIQQAALQMQQQPQVDTFQKQGSTINSALSYASVAGLGTGTAAYLLTDNKPVNGVFADSVLKSLEETPLKLAEANAKTLIENEQNKILKKAGVPKGINYEQLKAYSETQNPSTFSNISKNLSQPKAQELLSKVEPKIKAIDINAISSKAVKTALESTLEFKTDKLANLQSQKAQIAALSDNVDLKKFFQNNAKTFGLEGDEAKIEKEAEKLAKQYKTKDGAIKKYDSFIKQQQEVVNTARKDLNTKAFDYWDESTKAFKKDAPEALTKAYKNVKWNKAGKFGAIAAGIGLVFGALFGNKS